MAGNATENYPGDKANQKHVGWGYYTLKP